MKIKDKNLFKETKKWWLRITAIVFVLAIFLAGANFFYGTAYAHKFFPGVKISGVELTDISKSEAKKVIQEKIDEFNLAGINYNYLDKSVQIPFIITAPEDPDVIIELATFDLDNTLDTAYQYGRSGDYLLDLYYRAKSLLRGENIILDYDFKDEELINILKYNFYEYTKKAEDADYKIEEGTISIIPEKQGYDFDITEALTKTRERINSLNPNPISLNIMEDLPEVYQTDITPAMLEEVSDILAREELIITYQDKEWKIDKSIYQDWLSPKLEEAKVVNRFNENFNDYLTEMISPEVNQEAIEAKFQLTNSRVTEFQSGDDGREINYQETYKKSVQEIFNNKNNTFELAVDILLTKTKVGSINDLGITELLGVGESDFSGSPPNRIHNIGVGAGTLDGILIEPGETFSLITALGTIDGTTGYKQELVIKGDETIPEYGGGLCQVGTTIFRSALASGLPIIERKPHAYRVVYYEPAGKDATIYDPKPDVRFLNDTGNYILIQSRIEGNKLYFEFWGTSDGRIAEQTDSVIYNITSPGPTKYILDEDLEPSQKNCVESAHYGADAYFDYTVTYPDGEVKEERFSSHYVPWQAVCLVGELPEEALPPDEGNSTSTPENVE